MSTSEEFILEYDGDAVQAGEMDINDLAPSLLSFSRLCNEVNFALNGQSAKISVKVRSEFKRGSFGVDVHLIQSAVEQVKTLLGTSTVKDVKSILDTLGVMSDDVLKIGGALGLLGIATHIGRRKVKSAENTSAGTQLTLENNTIYLADPTAWRMYQRLPVRDDIETFTDPLRRDGFDEMRFRKDKNVLSRIEKSEVEDLTSDPDEDEIVRVVGHDESERTWVIRQPSLDPDLRTWRFYEGKLPITAIMSDPDFVARVLRHEQGFFTGDIMRVWVRATTRLTRGGYTKVDYEILKVENCWTQGSLLADLADTDETSATD